jgi:hypothetical protein
MTHRWYSPQLRREIVSRLYHRAKAKHVPMTVLANRIIERAIDSDESDGILIAKENSREEGAE